MIMYDWKCILSMMSCYTHRVIHKGYKLRYYNTQAGLILETFPGMEGYLIKELKSFLHLVDVSKVDQTPGIIKINSALNSVLTDPLEPILFNKFDPIHQTHSQITMWELTQLLYLKSRLMIALWIQLFPLLLFKNDTHFFQLIKDIKWEGIFTTIYEHKLKHNIRIEFIKNVDNSVLLQPELFIKTVKQTIQNALPSCNIIPDYLTHSSHSLFHTHSDIIKNKYNTRETNSISQQTETTLFTQEQVLTQSPPIAHIIRLDVYNNACTILINLLPNLYKERNKNSVQTNHAGNQTSQSLDLTKTTIHHCFDTKKTNASVVTPYTSNNDWSLNRTARLINKLPSLMTLPNSDQTELCHFHFTQLLDDPPMLSIYSSIILNWVMYHIVSSIKDHFKQSMLYKEELHRLNCSTTFTDDSMHDEPFIIWDPYCCSGNILKQCLSIICDMPAHPINTRCIDYPVYDLLRLNQRNDELFPMSQMWQTLQLKKDMPHIVDRIKLVGTDCRYSSLKKNVQKWKEWWSCHTPYLCVNHTHNVTQTNKKQLSKLNVWESLILHYEPIIVTSEILNSCLKDTTFRNHQSKFDQNDMNKITPINHIDSSLEFGIFHSNSIEDIAQHLHSPWIVSEFPWHPIILKQSREARLEFKKNINMLDRLIGSRNDWKDIFILTYSPQFTTVSQQHWTSCGKLQLDGKYRVELLRWSGYSKLVRREERVELLDFYHLE